MLLTPDAYRASLSNIGNRSEAMRDGPWKLVVLHPGARPGTFENEKVELYLLGNDLAETNDLATEPPDKTATMLKQLKVWFAETESDATPQPGGWLAE